MNYKRLIKNTLHLQRTNNMATVAIIGGVAVGLALGALFATKKGKSYRKKITDFLGKKVEKLENDLPIGDLIEDVRTHAKNNADSLLGPEKKRKKVTEVHANNELSDAWKNQKEKTIFPNDANPKLN